MSEVVWVEVSLTNFRGLDWILLSGFLIDPIISNESQSVISYLTNFNSVERVFCASGDGGTKLLAPLFKFYIPNSCIIQKYIEIEEQFFIEKELQLADDFLVKVRQCSWEPSILNRIFCRRKDSDWNNDVNRKVRLTLSAIYLMKSYTGK